MDIDLEFIRVLMLLHQAISLQGRIALSEQIFQTCKELIDDAKKGCADLVFKEMCLEILYRARHILTEKQFEHLVAYTAKKLQEKIPFNLEKKLMASR